MEIESCLLWQGEFDFQFAVCLDIDGRPVNLGPRSCGNMMCVRAAHLING